MTNLNSGLSFATIDLRQRLPEPSSPKLVYYCLIATSFCGGFLSSWHLWGSRCLD